jgi:hypothetical protein
MTPETEESPELGAEVAAGATTSAPDSGSWQVPGQPEREKREQPQAGKKVRRRRRAERDGTNPSAEDLPDVVPPRDDSAPGDSPHDRWLREQRPPHWE